MTSEFISLDRLLDTVACNTKITDHGMNASFSLDVPDDQRWSADQIYRMQIRKMYATHQAADRLVVALNRPEKFRPPWIELNLGAFLPGEDLAKEGLLWLLRISEQCSMANLRPVTRWDDRSSGAVPGSFVPILNETSIASRLGFHSSALIKFLNDEGIPHSLGALLTDPSGATTGSGQNSSPEPATAGKVFRIAPRGQVSPIEDLIVEAQRRANRSFDTNEVWLKLFEMAENNGTQGRLKVSDAGGLVVIGGDRKKGYSKDSLKSFLRRRKKKFELIG